MKIAVLGAGAWGTALAINLSERHQITLWTKFPEHLAELVANRVNLSFFLALIFLKHYSLPCRYLRRWKQRIWLFWWCL